MATGITTSEKKKSREILVAVDAREGSKEAFTWALENLIREGDVVTFLNVKPTTGLNLPLKSGIATAIALYLPSVTSGRWKAAALSLDAAPLAPLSFPPSLPSLLDFLTYNRATI